jgi:hypothetical protein
MLSFVGAGHARDQCMTFQQSLPEFRGRGPLLRNGITQKHGNEKHVF